MLRCSTNYRRIDEYSADVEPLHISRLYGGLLHLMDMGLLCYEGQIARYVGLDELRTARADWAKRAQAIGTGATEASEARIAALGAVIRSPAQPRATRPAATLLAARSISRRSVWMPLRSVTGDASSGFRKISSGRP